jgi:nucleotide-binding universal stress UspA family protein
MPAYRRIIALIEPRPGGEAVVRRALQTARFHGAALAIAGIVDYSPGFESDHVPFLTPTQMTDAICADVRERLGEILTRAGGGSAEIIVARGSRDDAVADILGSWKPDLVLVGRRAPHGLDKPDSRLARDAALPFDVLFVQNEPRSFAGRMVQAIYASI